MNDKEVRLFIVITFIILLAYSLDVINKVDSLLTIISITLINILLVLCRIKDKFK